VGVLGQPVGEPLLPISIAQIVSTAASHPPGCLGRVPWIHDERSRPVPGDIRSPPDSSAIQSFRAVGGGVGRWTCPTKRRWSEFVGIGAAENPPRPKRGSSSGRKWRSFAREGASGGRRSRRSLLDSRRLVGLGFESRLAGTSAGPSDGNAARIRTRRMTSVRGGLGRTESGTTGGPRGVGKSNQARRPARQVHGLAAVLPAPRRQGQNGRTVSRDGNPTSAVFEGVKLPRTSPSVPRHPNDPRPVPGRPPGVGVTPRNRDCPPPRYDQRRSAVRGSEGRLTWSFGEGSR
jgi:hypothetical protein